MTEDTDVTTLHFYELRAIVYESPGVGSIFAIRQAAIAELAKRHAARDHEDRRDYIGYHATIEEVGRVCKPC